MIEIGIFDKIAKLKNLFSGNDVDPDAKKKIEEYEERAKRLSDIDDFIRQPITKEISEKIYKRMKDHIKKKAWSRNLTDEEIKRYDDKWDELKWVLSMFRPNLKQEINNLIEEITYELGE